MTETFKARIETTNGHQVIILPPEIHLDGDEVAVQQNASSGAVTLSPTVDSSSMEDFFAFLDAHPIPEEEWEAFHNAILEGRKLDLPDDPDRVLRILLDDE